MTLYTHGAGGGVRVLDLELGSHSSSDDLLEMVRPNGFWPAPICLGGSPDLRPLGKP